MLSNNSSRVEILGKKIPDCSPFKEVQWRVQRLEETRNCIHRLSRFKLAKPEAYWVGKHCEIKHIYGNNKFLLSLETKHVLNGINSLTNQICLYSLSNEKQQDSNAYLREMNRFHNLMIIWSQDTTIPLKDRENISLEDMPLHRADVVLSFILDILPEIPIEDCEFNGEDCYHSRQKPRK